MNALPLILTVFVACAVEAIEALTIVLAAGITREWKSTFQGMAVALVVLAAITAVVGPAIAYLPLTPLRLVIGALLAIFGLQSARKAVLRATGYKALHDEASAYLREVTAAETAARESKRGVSDWYAFTLAFEGVLARRPGGRVHRDHLRRQPEEHRRRRIGAAAAIVVITITGIAVRAPLTKVPENWMKFAVGSCSPASARSGAPRARASPGGRQRRPARARPGRGPRLGGSRLLAALPQGGRRRPGQESEVVSS